MVRLIPVKYNNTRYPEDVVPKIVEVAAHFDRERVDIPENDYSLHTDPSYKDREFISIYTNDLSALKNSIGRGGVPRLWHNQNWVNDFFIFITRIIGNGTHLKIIEIHPPYDDYSDIGQFVDLYTLFEEKIKEKYPQTQIVIENRFGSRYSQGNFILSKIEDMINMDEVINSNRLNLKFVLDLPQIFTAEGIGPGRFSVENISSIFGKLKDIVDSVYGVHIWGKCLGRGGKLVSHVGTLDSYLHGLSCNEVSKYYNDPLDDGNIKYHFLSNLYDFLDDNKERYFVPEVKGRLHLHTIIKDMIAFGFEFV